MIRRHVHSGFTILEILIVIAALGLLVTLGAISINGARARMRDAQRMSDVSVLRSALSQMWFEKATYPVSTGVNLNAAGTNTETLTSEGFTTAAAAQQPVYLERVPTGPNANEYYRYKGTSNGYSIRFQTERDTALGKANVYFLHSTGIDLQDTEK